MSNPISAVTETATQVVKAPVAAVKSKPIVWALVFLVLALVILRYAGTIRRTLTTAPVVGEWFNKFIGKAA